MNSERVWQTQKTRRKTKQATGNIHPDRRVIQTTNNNGSNVSKTAAVEVSANCSGKSLNKRPEKRRSSSRKPGNVRSSKCVSLSGNGKPLNLNSI